MEFVRLFVILSVVAISIGYTTAFNCYLPRDPGPCKAYMPRFYYNIHSRTCEQFIYGGCAGNSNNFHYLGECLHFCSRKRGDTKTSSDNSDTKTSSDKRSMLSSLLDSLEKSSNKNGNDKRSNEKRVHPDCMLPRDPGPCRASFRRYYFNRMTGQCEQFIYGGCNGNPNNFYSLEHCRSVCL